MSVSIEDAVNTAIKACSSAGITPDQLAVELLKRGEEMGRGSVWNRGPVRSEAYRKFITSRFSCAVTGSSNVQAAHMNWLWHYEKPPYGRGMKTDDFRCVPLDCGIHRADDQLSGGFSDQKFEVALAAVDCLIAWIKNSR